MSTPAVDRVAAPKPASFATWVGFIAMCLGMFMAILDIQIVVTSLQEIRFALDIPADRMSWIQTAYLIAEIIAIPLTALLTRAFSMRGLFLGALSIFLLASVACAYASDFEMLIAARIVQGFAGGCLIPLVFSAVFILFDGRNQGIATTIAGALAVLAPTLGPTIGGYITETYDWTWLFLINIPPGIVALIVVGIAFPASRMRVDLLLKIDSVGLLSLGIGLAALEIALKDGPKAGWSSPIVISLLSLFVICTVTFVRRCLTNREPIAKLRLFAERRFAVACAVSFAFGITLFASVYLMPVFLGLIRFLSPLEIGLIMIVTGIAQLVASPIVVQLELRFDARLLTCFGLLLMAVGLAMSGFQTRHTGFDEMFWPQVVRGVAIMFCLIPPTRLALDHLSQVEVPDGSALFNLMRNIGGAVGIALVDTLMWQRGPVHAQGVGRALLQGNIDVARQIGIPPHLIPEAGIEPTAAEIARARPLVERAGLVEAINEAWLVLAVLALITFVLLLIFGRGTSPPTWSRPS